MCDLLNDYTDADIRRVIAHAHDVAGTRPGLHIGDAWPRTLRAEARDRIAEILQAGSTDAEVDLYIRAFLWNAPKRPEMVETRMGV